jgi:hypothetical protein
MPTDDAHKSRRDNDDKKITTDNLRDLLYEITYHWHYNQNAMRKTRNVLIKLIGEFARAELRQNGRAKSRRARKR